jgi:hypothetical protein
VRAGVLKKNTTGGVENPLELEKTGAEAPPDTAQTEGAAIENTAAPLEDAPEAAPKADEAGKPPQNNKRIIRHPRIKSGGVYSLSGLIEFDAEGNAEVGEADAAYLLSIAGYTEVKRG